VTRVCLLGDPDVNLTYELLSRETARDALATYEIEEPFENSARRRHRKPRRGGVAFK